VTLVEVQKNLRTLRTQVKAAASDETPLQRIDAQIVKETGGTLKVWDGSAVLDFVNVSVLAPLDVRLALTQLTVTAPAYLELETRAEAEENNIGLAGLRQIRSAAMALWANTVDAESGNTVISGTMPIFDAAVEALGAAESKEVEERGKAANAKFQALWKVVEPFFAEGVPAPEVCPVCTTPLTETKAGDAAGVRDHIAQHLAELADYAAAKNALDKAKTVATRAHTQLVATLPALTGLLDDSAAPLKVELAAYQSAVMGWPKRIAPTSANIIIAINMLVDTLNKKIVEIEVKQGDHTYVKAKAKVDRLLALQEERELATNTLKELGAISNALSEQAAMISGEIRKKVQALLDKLQSPMNGIYRLIQGENAVPIRLELPPEDVTNQQRLSLVIDFANNRTSVQPSGYLSDSQIHSVALALQLAAIKKFNTDMPFIALDDIVTSYDADHRRSVVGLIAMMFRDCQLLLTTHDERFFNYLKDQLEDKYWHFTRIIGLDPTYGPRFADHKITDEMIEARWSEGNSAANEMRQAEEEWLLGVCRDFGVNVRIRQLDKAYSYERNELASALASFLKGIELEPALVPGVNNRFLTSLQKGEIENFGSHFQDGLYGDGSIGDEKARWEEFKTFRNCFVCKKCNRTRFKRPYNLKKPVCACGNCEAQLELSIDVIGKATNSTCDV